MVGGERTFLVDGNDEVLSFGELAVVRGLLGFVLFFLDGLRLVILGLDLFGLLLGWRWCWIILLVVIVDWLSLRHFLGGAWRSASLRFRLRLIGWRRGALAFVPGCRHPDLLLSIQQRQMELTMAGSVAAASLCWCDERECCLKMKRLI